MDYDELTLLRDRDPGWKLLRSDNAPMTIAFLHRVFIEQNLRSVSEDRLIELLDDELYALNERLGERKYPKPPKLYLDDWTHSDRRWLRKFYPEDGDQPHMELSPATERALRWVESLQVQRDFIGTASRLSSIFNLLRELVHGTDEDPAHSCHGSNATASTSTGASSVCEPVTSRRSTRWRSASATSSSPTPPTSSWATSEA
ncbi:hypothetical protein GCM10029992_07380 [Glycomyces albus]